MKTKFSITLTLLLLISLLTPDAAIRAAAQAGDPPPLVPGGQAGWEDEPGHWRERLFDDHPVSADEYSLDLFPQGAGIPEQPLSLPFSATMVASGLSSTCALSSDGAVKCWGDNGNGRLGDGTNILRTTPVSVVGLAGGVKMISLSHKHACAVPNAGGLKCWGSNNHGELGDGTTQDRPAPVDVVGLSSGVVSVTAGGFHTCALLAKGGVKCWGANWHGQIGDGSTEERHLPVDVYGLSSGVTEVKAGKYHTCALVNAGMKCWGYNLYGQIGNGETTQRPKPAAVYGLNYGVQGIAMGALHTCALTQKGAVKCWGDNSYGQLGDGTHTDRNLPKDVTGLSSGIGQISAGGYFTCALPSAGGMKCWGDNWAGQGGNGSTSRREMLPVDVASLPDQVASMDAGDSHTCVVTSTGKVKCWGSNAYGQLGDSTSALRPAPVDVYGLSSGVARVGSGAAHSCALTTAGGVKCWGNNFDGPLGDGTTIYRLTPVDVSGLTSGVQAIAVGGYHTCALTTTGGVYCWGNNDYGQLGTNSTNRHLTPDNATALKSGVVAITAGFSHTCALMAAGGVKCWGDNGKGQLGVGDNKIREIPTDVIGLVGLQITGISAGESHTCALTSTGAVKCWGNNYDGQLGDGTHTNTIRPVDVNGLSGVAQVSAGLYHTCARTVDGRIQCWGGNFSGQLGNGSKISTTAPTDVTALGGAASQVSAGTQHSCAIVDGAVKCWGEYGGAAPSLAPVGISGLGSGMAFVAAGASASCAVTNAGGAKCWGSNSNGQVGDGSIPWRTTPGWVLGLEPAVLTVNYTGGQPGSFFTITGSKFIPNSSASLQVNSYAFSQTVSVDGNGGFVLRVSTSLAGEGKYYLSARAGVGATSGFRLIAGEPLRADEGQGPLFEIPAGIAYTQSLYLPAVRK